MVGVTQRFNFHEFTKKFRKSTTELPHLKDESEVKPKRSVPLIASPLDPKATAWLRKKHQTGNLTLKRRPTIAQFEADRFAGGIFRKQHEATTLELFFDLFFVGNLAVFTANHEHVSPQSVGNYVGFFAILWFTWFHTSIFDVRFYVDSLFNRFCKLLTFGIFTAFTGLGPIYDAIMYKTSTRAFHALALVLMVSRLLLLLQHATVLWFVRPFQKTVLPIALMMLVYLCSAMAFLGTYVDDNGAASIDYQKGTTHVMIWYVIIAVEAFAIIIISSVWRILSFKYTHLVERIGLLSLIIMGEGIIGLTKSVAYLLSGTNVSFWSIVGKVISAVLLVYEVYILYFSPIDHDRFGTIRQQVWTLLHFPLHVAFLLAEEGSAVTLLWDAVVRARMWLKSQLPDLTTPSTGFASSADWVKNVTETMKTTEYNYHYLKLKDEYDWKADLLRVSNITDPFGSAAWNRQASVVLNDIYAKTSNFFFGNFNFEMSKKMKDEPDPYIVLDHYFDAYQTVYTFFFAASGSILLLLALMYAIGKRGKSKEEYAAIIVRIVIGVGIPCTIVAGYTQPIFEGFAYNQSGWIISVVTLCFLLVVVLDNHINSWVDKKVAASHEDSADGGEKGHGHGHGHGHTHSASDGHHYNAIHGGHVDAHSAALHFGKPASFEHGHDGHHGASHSHDRSMSHGGAHGHHGESEENTPFVSQPVDFPIYPDTSFSPPAEGGRQSPSFNHVNTSYHGYNHPAHGHQPGHPQIYASPESHPRGVQLYEPTMASPAVHYHGEA